MLYQQKITTSKPTHPIFEQSDSKEQMHAYVHMCICLTKHQKIFQINSFFFFSFYEWKLNSNNFIKHITESIFVGTSGLKICVPFIYRGKWAKFEQNDQSSTFQCIFTSNVLFRVFSGHTYIQGYKNSRWNWAYLKDVLHDIGEVVESSPLESVVPIRIGLRERGAVFLDKLPQFFKIPIRRCGEYVVHGHLPRPRVLLGSRVRWHNLNLRRRHLVLGV